VVALWGGGENGDILRFQQFLWTYDQSEARIESHRETIEGKGGESRLGRLLKKAVQQGRSEQRGEAYASVR
jgi:hypothetical protein